MCLFTHACVILLLCVQKIMHDDSRSPMAGICGHTVFHTHACVYNIYAPFPCVMCHDGKRFTRHSSTCVSPEVSLYIQGVMLGKRKSLMKSIELREKRKRRREELEVVLLSCLCPSVFLLIYNYVSLFF